MSIQTQTDPVILAIESSCDDTSAAVMRNGKILSNLVANQQIHEQYGGVVPELASRAHQQHIVPVVDAALKQASISIGDVSAIAFTQGPGLIGSLLVGASFAKSMAAALGIPLLAVNHMEAHILAHFIDAPQPDFPFLCLTISGGHTLLTLVNKGYTMETIGHTLDDAAGEAFDKGAKLLGLPYPGGPLIDRMATHGNPHAFVFPVPQIPEYDFSFSGLKTALMYFLQKKQTADPAFIKTHLADICASYQHAIAIHLFQKLTKAAKQYRIKDVGIAGGVAANSYIRSMLAQTGHQLGWTTHIPQFSYCTDNAAMVAMAGSVLYHQQQFASKDVSPYARNKE